jgi:hypothetical protein
MDEVWRYQADGTWEEVDAKYDREKRRVDGWAERSCRVLGKPSMAVSVELLTREPRTDQSGPDEYVAFVQIDKLRLWVLLETAPTLLRFLREMAPIVMAAAEGRADEEESDFETDAAEPGEITAYDASAPPSLTTRG